MSFKAILNKLMKDNLGTLASIVSWSVLTSLVPITVGLIAISGIVLSTSPSLQQSVVSHLSQALQGVVTPHDLQNLVGATIRHTGLFGIIGIAGVLWGGSNVGGAISTVMQPIFEVRGRNFFVEKLIDIGMIFVFTALMIVIIVGTTLGAFVDRLFSKLSLPGIVPFTIGTVVSLAAAFLLFLTIYVVFPNVSPRFKVSDAWKGALVAAVLFEILSYIWPLYAHFAHFKKDGALLGSLVLLMAWVYFFSITLVLGAEVVAISALHSANRQDASVGPRPDGFVPQHEVLRDDREPGAATPSSAE